MSISHLIGQQKMIFWQKICQSESSGLTTLAYLKRNQCNGLRSKYGLCPYDGTRVVKHAVFRPIIMA